MQDERTRRASERFSGNDFATVTAIVALSRDLVDVTTRAEILDALCLRIKDALGAPAAYVALTRRGRSEGVVCSTDGIETKPFRSLRLPHRVGLAGAVISDGRVRSTDDYTVDRTLVHSANLDRRVDDEGLHGILAAPLRINGTVVGAAMAGSRVPRRFDTEEAATVQVLCDIAGSNLARLDESRKLRLKAAEREDRLRHLQAENSRQRERLAVLGSATCIRQRELLALSLVTEPPLDDAGFAALSQSAGVAPEALYAACVVLAPNEAADQLRPEWSATLTGLGGFGVIDKAGSFDTRLIALMPVGYAEPFNLITPMLGGIAAQSYSAWSSPVSGRAPLTAALSTSTRAARLLRSFGRAGETTRAADLSPLELFASGAEPGEIAALIDRLLAPVLGIEVERRTRLVATLHSWFTNEGRAKAVARDLGLHINTVYARIEQLDNTLGTSWRSGQRRLEFETAVRLHLMASGPHTS